MIFGLNGSALDLGPKAHGTGLRPVISIILKVKLENPIIC